ncbi:MAG: hypothetical protein IJQ81_16290 [Oscillibacter sp.]|nr:hypothetical protein [Oscillibacter sp.]
MMVVSYHPPPVRARLSDEMRVCRDEWMTTGIFRKLRCPVTVAPSPFGSLPQSADGPLIPALPFPGTPPGKGSAAVRETFPVRWDAVRKLSGPLLVSCSVWPYHSADSDGLRQFPTNGAFIGTNGF